MAFFPLFALLLAVFSPVCNGTKLKAVNEQDLHVYYQVDDCGGSYSYLMPLSMHREHDLLREGVNGRLAVVKRSQLGWFENHSQNRVERVFPVDDRFTIGDCKDFFAVDGVMGAIFDSDTRKVTLLFNGAPKKGPKLSLCHKQVGPWQLSLANATMVPLVNFHDAKLLHRFKLFDRDNGRLWLTVPSFSMPKPYSLPMLFVNAREAVKLISFVETLIALGGEAEDLIGVKLVKAVEFSSKGLHSILIFFDSVASVAQIRRFSSRVHAYQMMQAALPSEPSSSKTPYTLTIDGKTLPSKIEIAQPLKKGKKTQELTAVYDLRDEHGVSLLIHSLQSIVCAKKSLWSSLMAFKMVRQGSSFIYSISVITRDSPLNWAEFLGHLLEYLNISQSKSFLQQFTFHPQSITRSEWLFGDADISDDKIHFIVGPELPLLHPNQLDHLPLISEKSALVRGGFIRDEMFVCHHQVVIFHTISSLNFLWKHIAKVVLSPLCPSDLVNIILHYDPVRMYSVAWFSFGILTDPRRDRFLDAIQAPFVSRLDDSRVGSFNDAGDFGGFLIRFISPSPFHIYTQKGSMLTSLGQPSYKREMVKEGSAIIMHHGPIPTPFLRVCSTAPLLSKTDVEVPGRAIRISKMNDGGELSEILILEPFGVSSESCSEVLHVNSPSAPWFFFKREGEDSKMRLEGVDLTAVDILASSANEWLILRGGELSSNLVQLVFTQRTVAQVLDLMNLVNIVGARLWKQGNNFAFICESSQKDSILAAMNAHSPALPFDLNSFALAGPVRTIVASHSNLEVVAGPSDWLMLLAPETTPYFHLSNPLWILQNYDVEKLEEISFLTLSPRGRVRTKSRVFLEINQVTAFYRHILIKLATCTLPPFVMIMKKGNNGLNVAINIDGSLTDAYAITDEWTGFGKRTFVSMKARPEEEEKTTSNISTATCEINDGSVVGISHSQFKGSMSPHVLLTAGWSFIVNAEQLDGLKINFYRKPDDDWNKSLMVLKATLTPRKEGGNDWQRLFTCFLLNHAALMSDPKPKFDKRLISLDMERNGDAINLHVAWHLEPNEYHEPYRSAVSLIWHALLLYKLPSPQPSQTNPTWILKWITDTERKHLESGKDWKAFLAFLPRLPFENVQEWILAKEGTNTQATWLIEASLVDLPSVNAEMLRSFLRHAFLLLFSRLPSLLFLQFQLTGNQKAPLRIILTALQSEDASPQYYEEILNNFVEWIVSLTPLDLTEVTQKVKVESSFSWLLNGQKVSMKLTENAPTEKVEPLQPPATPAAPQPVKLHREWILSSSAGEASIKTTFDFESAWPVHLSPTWMKLSLAPQYLVSKWREIKLVFIGDEAPFEAAVTLKRHVLECKEIYRRSIVAVTLTAEGESACEEQLSEAEAFLEYYGFSKEEDVEDWESHPASELSDLQWARLNGFGITLPVPPSVSNVVAEASNSSDGLSNGVHFNWADEGEGDSNLIVEQMQHLCIDDKFEVEEEEEEEEYEKHWILAVRFYTDTNEAKLTRLFEMLSLMFPGEIIPN